MFALLVVPEAYEPRRELLLVCSAPARRIPAGPLNMGSGAQTRQKNVQIGLFS